MLAAALGRLPGVLGCLEEGNYFERREAMAALPPAERVDAVVRRLRLDGAPVPASTESALRATLTVSAEAGASTDALFEQGADVILKAEGSTRWVQKATSYVFHVDRILTTFPDAYLVFLVRNPLDVAASLKRRGNGGDLFRMAWGWRSGVGLAFAHQRSHPDRFRVVRYEDLVQSPEAVVRDVCAFVGLPYSDEAVDVAHVNRAEDKYALTSERRGITASRVFHYGSILGTGEAAAVRQVAGGLLDEAYPELVGPAPTVRVRARGLLYVGLGAVRLAGSQARQIASGPAATLGRIRRRLGK